MDFFEQIEAFIHNKLSLEERTAFEVEMEQNPQLARAVKHYPATQTIYNVLLEDSIRNQIKLHHPSEQAQKLSNRKSTVRARWILAAAASMLLLMVCGTLWYAHNTYSNTALVSKFVDLPNLTAVKGAASVDRLSQARHAFSESNFDQAIDLLAPVKEQNPANEEARHILAYAYLMKGESNRAIALFTKVIEQNHSRKERAEWHLVLAYLQSHNPTSAGELLATIKINPTHAYYQEAEKLQRHLDSVWRKFQF